MKAAADSRKSWLSIAYRSRILKSAALPNPKGIPQQSPGLRGTSYPGIMRRLGDNPERVAVAGNCSATRPQPRWGCETSAIFTQGSSSLATLGFVAESLWDSFQPFPLGSLHDAPPFSGSSWSYMQSAATIPGLENRGNRLAA